MSASRESGVSGPRWLSGDQLAAWRGFMKLAQRLPAALEAQLQQDSKLSFIEYYVLAHLSDQPGRRMRMSELAVLANTELSRLSHMIGRLEKRGLVRREPDPDNGRYTQAILTDEGHAYLAAAAPGHVGRVLDLFADVLTPNELRTLHRISDKVLARVERAQGSAKDGRD
ncbi:MarR family transcriptional regulator [Amycolatopsis sp. NPDC051102]|uniref:MarR family winged helix-turn-helix transcriptional regulator n=1 Tax=Amycolatopsis sp. NPDC051102 TaxID=3155163 RepID=UPI003422B2B1